MVIDVAGPHVAGLEITGANLKQQDDQGTTFVIAVRNTGNIFMKAEGSLLITDREGKELASIPLKMGTVLPGDATTFQVAYPVRLADGRYFGQRSPGVRRQCDRPPRRGGRKGHRRATRDEA